MPVDISEALAGVENSPVESPQLPDISSKDGRKKILNTYDNLEAIANFYGWIPCFNDMAHEAEVLDCYSNLLGGSLEGQYSKLVDACQLSDMPKESITDHLPALCKARSYHPVAKYLSGANWDGVKRVEQVIDTLNAKDPELAIAVLWPWLVGCIACLYESRFSTKLTPIIQGGQSFKKSAWLSRIGSIVDGAYRDCSLNPSDRDSVKIAIASWVVELGEMETTTRHESGLLKAFLTRHEDKFRAPYARTETAKKRKTSFIGTVNGTGFLKDTTGSVRFAVIEMQQEADIDRLNELLGWQFNGGRISQTEPELLKQFWLEVKYHYDNGRSWALDDHTLVKVAGENDKHTDKGAIYDKIADAHLARPKVSTVWFTPSELCEYHRDKPCMNTQYGKALKLLAEEGLINSRELRSRRKEFELPVFSEPDDF